MASTNFMASPEWMQLVSAYKSEVGKLQKMEKENQQLAETARDLTAKLQENQMVLKELELVGEGETVFKVIGPVMVNKSIDEAIETVKGRLDHINRSLAGMEEQASKIMDRMKEQNKRVGEIQGTLQALQHAASRK